jgi:hypothetical protein
MTVSRTEYGVLILRKFVRVTVEKELFVQASHLAHLIRNDTDIMTDHQYGYTNVFM